MAIFLKFLLFRVDRFPELCLFLFFAYLLLNLSVAYPFSIFSDPYSKFLCFLDDSQFVIILVTLYSSNFTFLTVFLIFHHHILPLFLHSFFFYTSLHFISLTPLLKIFLSHFFMFLSFFAIIDHVFTYDCFVCFNFDVSRKYFAFQYILYFC